MAFGGKVHVNKTSVFSILVTALFIVLLYKFSKTPAPNIEYVSMKELLAAAIDSAQKGGKIVQQIRDETTLNMRSKGKTLEGANDPVTDGDMKSHIQMFYSLKKAFPSVEVISEEHETKYSKYGNVLPAATENFETMESLLADELVLSDDVKIWIDPLDATQEYTEDLREYVTTMVCVAVKGVPTIGVIYKPFEETTYWGWANYRTSENLRNIVRKNKSKDDALSIIVSRSHTGDVEKVTRSAFGDETKIIKAGGAGFKTLAIVLGRADAYVHVTLIKKWDLCAGNAIINSLQGKMTTLLGDSIRYNSKEDYTNSDGVLATLYNHSNYLSKLKILKQNRN